jgi:hypothetical protein
MKDTRNLAWEILTAIVSAFVGLALLRYGGNL